MAFLFADSVDHYATAQITKKYTAVEFDSASTGALQVTAGIGRDATSAIRFGQFLRNWGATVIGLAPGDAKCIAGCHHFWNNTINVLPIEVRKSGATQFALHIRTDGRVELRAGVSTSSALIAATAAGVVNTGTWHFFAFEVTVGNSASYTVQMDGATILTGTGDTQATAAAGWDSVVFYSFGTNTSVFNSWFDEVFVWDGTGSTCNSLPPEHRVERAFPIADGAHTGWIKSAGSDAYALVDEATPDLADYVSAATVTARQSFTFPAPATDPIAGVQLGAYLRADIAGVRQVRAGLRIGGTNYPHATAVSIGSDDRYYLWRWEINPATSAAFVLADYPLEAYLEIYA